MKPRIVITCLTAFLLFIPVLALSYQGEIIYGTVVHVHNGDTVLIDTGNRSFTCRLEDIDSPEISGNGKPGQLYGVEAGEELKRLILRQQVKITLTGEKTYKREVCYITKDGVDINREMIARGYAWAYSEYLKGPWRK
jgi:endonuclease YncB( thermonuclease family)